jgi:hypothetical protein
MSTPKKKDQPSLLTDAQIQALNNLGSASTSITGTKAVDAAPIDNKQIGLKDAKGKLLPDTITVAQMQAVLADKNNKYNAAAVENLKQLAIVNMPLNTTLSPTGSISPAEIAAIRSGATQAYNSTPVGTPIKLVDTFAAIKSGTLGGASDQQTTFSRTTLDQPNIEASKSTINDIFLNYLGRSASEKEIAQYTQKYLNYAAKNPTNVSSGVTTYKNVTTPSAAGGISTRMMKGTQSESSVSNNLTEQEFMKNQVRQSGEYNAFTAAGSAFDMLTNMAKKDTGAM